MIIAHFGPPTARIGGQAGYLHELANAAAIGEPARHVVILPATAIPGAPRSPSWPHRVRQALGRVKRSVLGRPTFFRPSEAELRSRHGGVDRHIRDACEATIASAAPSLDRVIGRKNINVLFAHDAFCAGHLLDERGPRQEVWLFAHAPFPLALFLIWSYGIPEWDWREICALPDVRAWIDWELAVWQRVDRLIFPCPEAAEGLVEIDQRFAAIIANAHHLLTGGASPPSPTAAVDREVLRGRFGLPAGVPVGLFLGSPQPYRGLDALFAALDRLPSGNAVPGAVAIAGPLKESVPAHPRLIRLGRVADVGGLLRAVDFSINVNRFCLFDLSSIEAAEAGKPFLLHRVGGNKTLHQLGAGCVLLEDLAPGTVAAGLERLFRMSEAERGELGRATKACYDNHLTPELFWQRHQRLYDEAALEKAALGWPTS
jgi:glycosyltransferase involved in cell wall biosynthesis